MSTGIAVRKLWETFQDDMSRDIFTKRLLYFLDEDPRHISSIVASTYRDWIRRNHNLPTDYNVFDPASPSFNRNAPIVIFGAGWLGKQIAPLLLDLGYTSVFFSDNDATLHGQTIDGIATIPPRSIASMNVAAVVFAIQTESFVNEVARQLLAFGIAPAVIHRLPAVWDNEYFNPSFFPPGRREVYIDAGCYSSGTIKNFAAYCGGNYEAIYGFEPDPASYERVLEELGGTGLANVAISQKGVWSSSGQLSFHDGLGGSAAIDDAGRLTIDTVALDEMNITPTFIKMDVEGAELEALRGAEKTLRTHRPRLAICIYHKNEDVLDIPLYLQEIVPDYKFYIRHHSFCELDTVLYATV